MENLQRADNLRNRQPDLLAWAEVRHHRPATTAGRFLAKRYRVAPNLADAIANANGLGVTQ